MEEVEKAWKGGKRGEVGEGEELDGLRVEGRLEGVCG